MNWPRFRAGALCATVLMLSASSPLRAQPRAADSARAVLLLRESAEAALSIPPSDSLRIDLLRRAAKAQVSAGDIAGAMTTARSLGGWGREVQIDATCRLLEDRRLDDAHRLVRQLPEGERDWALAHLASQLARPPWSPRRQRPDTVDSAALAQRALAVAAEVREPRARVDALISIARSLLARKDTGGAAAAFAAAQQPLASVRDADFVSTRRLMIADGFGVIGRTAAALALMRSLQQRDRLHLAWYLPGWRDARQPPARAELRALIPLLDTGGDPRARARRAEALVSAARSLGELRLADSIERRTRVVDPATGRPWRWNDVSPSTVDRAATIAASNVERAIAMVDSLDDPLRVGRRARAYVRLALAVPRTKPDAIARLLRRARRAALQAPLGMASRDRVLSQIAGEQVGRGFFDDAVVTIGAIRDRDLAVAALYHLGGTTFAPLSPRARRRFVARLANADVRAAASACIVEQTLQIPKLADADLAWATALADSLPPSPSLEPAYMALVSRALGRGDTTTARTRLLSLLAAHKLPQRPERLQFRADELLSMLVRAGAVEESVAWARSRPTPTERAAALLELARAIAAVAKVGQPLWISNGPDMCREEF